MTDADYKPRYTVSSLTGDITATLEPRFSRIFVDGEISGWRLYPSGHAYFTLKDAGAQISAVMFRSALERCRARDGLKDGAKVLICGKVTVYGPRGQYQLVANAARLEGEGDLMQRYLELKAKLTAEGLFDAARKRTLPPMPRRIGIVTSEAGAVIHDMCTVLTRRFPNLSITLYPSLVQGAEAPRSLMAGIGYFNRTRPDLVIIARGGGSFEDLFCFNDEGLVRAVAACAVPTISAVGHETDFTLCDFAADVRAGTPSIAAEIAVPVKAELTARLAACDERLATALRARGEWFAQRLDHLSDALASALLQSHTTAVSRLDRLRSRLVPSAAVALAQTASRLDGAKVRLEPAVTLAFTRAESRYAQLRAKLDLLSPYGVLDRGYALVMAPDGSVLREAARIRKGESLDVRLAHGHVAVTAASDGCAT